MRQAAIELTLSVRSERDGIWARLSFSNRGSSTFFLEKRNAPDPAKTRNQLFEISADGVEVEYTGIMVKRLPSSRPEHYIAIEPGASHQAEVELSSSYRFPQPPALCEVQYYAINVQLDSIESQEIQSEKVQLELR